MELSSEMSKWHGAPQPGAAGNQYGWWWLGKRIFLAGAAVTSAPVLAPPLLLFSAIGLAFSLPFVILVAAYAATTKLLRYFLSPPPPQLSLEAPGAERRDLGGVSEVGAHAGKVFDEMPMREEVAEGESAFEETPLGIEEMAGPVEREVFVIPEWGESPVGGVEVQVVDVEEGEAMEVWPVGAEEVRLIDTEAEEPVGENEGEVIREVSEGPFEVPVRVTAAVVYPDVKVEVVQEGAVGREFPALSPVDLLQAEERLIPVAMPAVVDKAVDESVEVREPGGEDLPPLEKISVDIEALRTIVGYTATRLSSPVEELKALYIFTGIEPPVSLGEASSLEEIRSRLQFLKSVVGVK